MMKMHTNPNQPSKQASIVEGVSSYENESIDHLRANQELGDNAVASTVHVANLGAEVDKMTTHQFVTERLGKNEDTTDLDGLKRPSFQVNGREIVFRNRQEKPEFADRQVAVLGANVVSPLPVEGFDVSVVSHYNEQYAANHGTENMGVVTNTPEGMVAAALELTSDEGQGVYLQEIAGKLHEKRYAEPDVQNCIDGILASISIDDNGDGLMYYDTDGYAVALAALAGDKDAQAIVEQKRTALIDNEAKRRAETALGAKRHAESIRSTYPELEPLPLDQMALVHSTEYPIERDENGNIILFPAAQKRPDEFPRASLHFTVNSRVVAHAEAQDAWGDKHKMIIANFQKVMDATGSTPEVLDGVDTWFINGPGEHTVLPDAVVVEPATADGELITQTENGITFKQTDHYSADELREIDSLAVAQGFPSVYREYTAPHEQLKEIVLRMAMQRVGVPSNVQDFPSGSGHGMDDYHLAMRVYQTAAAIGARSGTHFNHPESSFERELSAGINGDFIEKTAPSMITKQERTHNEAALGMRRQALVSGYVPSRPNTQDRSAFEDMEYDPDIDWSALG